MDQRAALWANHLLGNDVSDALLEVTLGGLRLRFEDDALLSLTGADCGAELDGRSVEPWRSFRVASGQVLDFGYAVSGMRSCLAFSGGLCAPTLFQSASVVVREGLPGRLGRPLRKGDVVEWLDAGTERMVRHVPRRRAEAGTVSSGDGVIEVPLYTGYEWVRFSERDQRAAFELEWVIHPSSDRVATRLDGPVLTSGPTVLDSVPLVDGTVQITGEGVPLVFMRDRPTIGGYPKLGSVDPVALDALAQARPGTRIRFVAGDRADGLRALRRRARFFGLAPARIMHDEGA